MSYYHWGEFQTHAFHVVPSMSPIVSVVTYVVYKTHSRKADQSAKPGNATVYGYCMRVAISWANKMELA